MTTTNTEILKVLKMDNNRRYREIIIIAYLFALVAVVALVSIFLTSDSPYIIKQAFAQQSNPSSTNGGPIDMFTENPTGSFNASGSISSLLTVSNTTPYYVLSGHWKLIVSHEKVKSFEVNFVMVTVNGTGFHIHSITNFRSDAVVPVILDKYGTTFVGLTDLKIGNSLAWYSVPTTVSIFGHNTIRIMLNSAYIENHFLGQPIYGVVDSILA